MSTPRLSPKSLSPKTNSSSSSSEASQKNTASSTNEKEKAGWFDWFWRWTPFTQTVKEVAKQPENQKPVLETPAQELKEMTKPVEVSKAVESVSSEVKLTQVRTYAEAIKSAEEKEANRAEETVREKNVTRIQRLQNVRKKEATSQIQLRLQNESSKEGVQAIKRRRKQPSHLKQLDTSEEFPVEETLTAVTHRTSKYDKDGIAPLFLHNNFTPIEPIANEEPVEPKQSNSFSL